MDADIKGALQQINTSYKAFTHKGVPMTKKQVEGVLRYALSQNYTHTSQLTDDEVDKLLKPHKR